MAGSFKQRSILVTRPDPSGTRLSQKIVEQGDVAILFPTIEIEPIEAAHSFEEADWVIFISPHSVYHGLRWINEERAHWIAIGEGTRQALVSLSKHSVSSPSDARSEGILSMPELQSIQDKKIVIVCGEGGRTLLQETLMRRGAKVSRCEVYRRKCPRVDVTSTMTLLQQHRIDMMLATSIEGLDNLVVLLKCDSLFQTPLLVVSDRIKEHADVLGFKKVFLSANASDEAIMDALKRMNDDRSNK